MDNKIKYILNFTIILFSISYPSEIFSNKNLYKGYYFLFDKKHSMAMGSSAIISTCKLYGELNNYLFSYVTFKENNIIKKISGISIRLIKLYFLDNYSINYLSTIHHEYFSHGYRIREFEYNAKYSIYHPWSDKRSYVYYSYNKWNIDKLMHITTSGIEGNTFLSLEIQKRAYFSGKIDYYHSLLYLFNKLYINSYIYNTPSPRKNPSGFYEEYQNHGDIAKYLAFNNFRQSFGYGIFKFHEDYYIDPNITSEYDQLIVYSFWNYLDPLVFSSLYNILKHIYSNKKYISPYMFYWKNLKWMPGTSFNLTPNGKELYLNFWGKYNYTLNLILYLRLINGIYGNYYGLGSGIDSIKLWNNLYIGLIYQFWNQPVMLEDEEYPYNLLMPKVKKGHSTVFKLWYFPVKYIGVVLKIKYKTEGFLIGERYTEGFDISYGIHIPI